MIREMAVAFCRVTGVQPTPEQVKAVEMQIRTHFAGERVYVAGYPKAQRVAELQRMANKPPTAREQAKRLGINERHLRRVLTGK